MESANLSSPFILSPTGLIGEVVRGDDHASIAGAIWYTAEKIGDGISYTFPIGALTEARYLAADLLLTGHHLAVFLLSLQEGVNGPTFSLTFGALNECSARLRLPLDAVNQNRWGYPREGAWLKPRCSGERVDLRRVDRMRVTVHRKSSEPVHWCLTNFRASSDQPDRLASLVLPHGPLLDDLGQSAIHNWPERSPNADTVSARLRQQLARASESQWPEGFSRWGGWEARRVEGTGFFRTHHDGRRWWLVDPDGFLFWSAGLDCVRVDIETAYAGLESALTWLPDHDGPFSGAYDRGYDGSPTISYLATNLMRAFGAKQWRQNWATIALATLRQFGFNTVGNWSEWEYAKAAQIPYVRPLQLTFTHAPLIYRDFPDVYDSAFEEDARALADQLRATVHDPALIGYFLGNEPTWGFINEPPAAGMLYTTSGCRTREALRDYLRERYGSDASLSQAWGMETSYAAIAEGRWQTPLTPDALADLTAFSTIMVDKLYRGLSDACREVDPHHLNLGARFQRVPPRWVVDGMRHFDVFSINCYAQRVRAPELEEASAILRRPVLIGEWHFGALNVGLPASGIGHVRDQVARGQAFRVYTEDAAAKPWCVGTHYFTLYDESALGRFDGENYQIGFLDVCHRAYEALADAARATHSRVYQVALGEMEPYDDVPEYLPLLF